MILLLITSILQCLYSNFVLFSCQSFCFMDAGAFSYTKSFRSVCIKFFMPQILLHHREYFSLCYSAQLAENYKNGGYVTWQTTITIRTTIRTRTTRIRKTIRTTRKTTRTKTTARILITISPTTAETIRKTTNPSGRLRGSLFPGVFFSPAVDLIFHVI